VTTVTGDDIAALTQSLYAAVYDERGWPDAAAAIKRMIPARVLAIGVFEARTGGQQLLYGECEESYGEICFAPETENPVVGAPLGRVVSDVTLMSRREFERSVFFNNWLRPQGDRGFVAINTASQGRITGFFGGGCGFDQRPLEQEDLALLGRLTPLMTRVVNMRSQLGALRLAERNRTYDRLNIGMMVVDAHGRLLGINDTAENLLAGTSSGLGALRGVIEAGRSTTQLRRLLADAFAEPDGRYGLGGYMIVPPADGMGRGLAVTVAPMADAGLYGLPVGQAATIFVQPLDAGNPGNLEQRLAGLFGFTGKEAQVAGALIEGHSLKQAAEMLNISIHTARTHLAQLFVKTSTGQQSQLVALLARLISPDGGN